MISRDKTLEFLKANGHLRGQNLNSVMLDKLDLSGVDFSGSNLQHAFLRESNLTGANFSGANLRGAFLNDCVIHNSDFSAADLRFAKLLGAKISDSKFAGAFYDIGTRVDTKSMHIFDSMVQKGKDLYVKNGEAGSYHRGAHMTLRPVLKKLAGQPTTDGAGVSLKRFIGSNEISFVDPFLLLDEFKNEDPKAYIAGFPEHPHRGFETVSYMIEGRMRHRDSRGNNGLLTAGSAQWMTAARGIIHSEMPQMDASKDKPMLWGYQLWVTRGAPENERAQIPGYSAGKNSRSRDRRFSCEAHRRRIRGKAGCGPDAYSRDLLRYHFQTQRSVSARV